MWPCYYPDADRDASIIASNKECAKVGRRLVVMIEEVIRVETAKGVILVRRHVRKFMIEGVSDRRKPVFKKVQIRRKASSSMKIACEVTLIKGIAIKV